MWVDACFLPPVYERKELVKEKQEMNYCLGLGFGE